MRFKASFIFLGSTINKYAAIFFSKKPIYSTYKSKSVVAVEVFSCIPFYWLIVLPSILLLTSCHAGLQISIGIISKYFII
jgi:hypothetical protein